MTGAPRTHCKLSSGSVMEMMRHSRMSWFSYLGRRIQLIGLVNISTFMLWNLMVDEGQGKCDKHIFGILMEYEG